MALCAAAREREQVDVPLAAARAERLGQIESLPLAADAATRAYFAQRHSSASANIDEEREPQPMTPVRLAADSAPEVFQFYLTRGIPFITASALPPWTSASLRVSLAECLRLASYAHSACATWSRSALVASAASCLRLAASCAQRCATARRRSLRSTPPAVLLACRR